MGKGHALRIPPDTSPALEVDISPQAQARSGIVRRAHGEQCDFGPAIESEWNADGSDAAIHVELHCSKPE
jgi:hypothetical protein